MFGNIKKFDQLGSTNDMAKDLSTQGEPHGTVIWAERQTAGRGRQGRNWQSLGGNLFCSFILRPQGDVAGGLLSLMVGVAVFDAVAEVIGADDLSLKWPNDILLNKAKLGGILLEADADWIVAGIGINVQTAPDLGDVPTSCINRPGVDAAKLLDRLIYHLSKWYDRPEEVINAWRDRAAFIGQRLAVQAGNQKLDGVFEGVDDSGALLLKLDDGSTKHLMSGEVHVTSH